MSQLSANIQGNVERRWILLLGAIVFVATSGGIAVSSSPGAAPVQTRTISFNRDVRPILSESCFRCHGNDAADIKGKLRLNDEKDATRDRGGYRAITPGNPSRSMILSRITTDVAEMKMPPPHAGMKPLTDAQIDILAAWIQQGAKYEPHWSFVAPKKPPFPTVKQKDWIKNGVDLFVLSGLEKAGLKPEAEADRATLLRRLSLTLTGLQPTPDEIARFVNSKDPKAYEKEVDRLLASPRYGEHQARAWLDAVRYGDTHGLHLDNERAIHPYRDWVVRAFNEDLPYDQFTTWQLAGDLLPNPTIDQRIATGYIRMNPTTNEGGAIEEEFLAKNTFDRVDTFSTIFLGLTVGCARCHDHKYDPLSQRDYFSLYAYFNSTTDRPLDGNLLTPEPVMRARSKAQQAIAEKYESIMAGARTSLDDAQVTAWAESRKIYVPTIGAWEVSGPFSAANFDLAHDTEFGPEPGGVADPNQWRPLAINRGQVVGIVGKENSAGYARTTLTSDGDRDLELRFGSDDGIRVWLNGELVHNNKVARGATAPTDTVRVKLRAGANELIVKVSNGGGPDGLVYDVGDAVSEAAGRLLALRATDPKKSSADLRELYLNSGPETEATKAFRTARADLAQLDSTIPLTLVAEELPKPRQAYILRRGEYNLPTQPAYRRVPTVLGTTPKDSPQNRLGLAKWLTAPSHPLFARVTVNRWWQAYFGHGLVKTAEDFGLQGEWPSNPDLLDYLAVRFAEVGYSQKALHRILVTSAAFRQQSVVSKAKLDRDPENRLVSRGPRYRLEAEVLRDAALHASGLLKEELGGKGFKPYQPEGLWEALGFLESNTARYVQDIDDSIYRRSLYMFWKRTSPHPIMLTFDAPMRESCVVRRGRTNTPLQALITLNETAFVESARVLAERVMSEAKTDDARLDRLYTLTLGRQARPQERILLKQSLQRYRQRYQDDRESARQLVTVGFAVRDSSLDVVDHAAWTMIASTLLNTDEFLSLQ